MFSYTSKYTIREGREREKNGEGEYGKSFLLKSHLRRQ